MKKYILTKNFKDGLKKGMVFQWNKAEGCYITKELPWMFTPLIPRTQLNRMIKNGNIKSE